MSGGIDSSVTAAILKAQGYEVTGFTMKLWDDRYEDAKRVAIQLGIPHKVIDLREAFKREVVDYFVSEYSKGRTPNPCVVCNQKIKFGLLLQEAMSIGADFIATGHYAKVEYEPKLKRYTLKKGKDNEKDQSYFLAQLSQESLSKTLLPLGNYTKTEVRKMAVQMQLKVAKMPESQEICFIQDNDYESFIQKQTSVLKEGNIIDKNGEVLGSHKGIVGYTIGQRRGIPPEGGRSEPFYVTGIDLDRNIIKVGDESDLYSNYLIAERLNWISINGLDKEIEVESKVRYRQEGVKSKIVPQGANKVLVKFNEPQRAITPGQLAVFYKGNTVIGSGWIMRL